MLLAQCGGFVIAHAQLHPDHLRSWLELNGLLHNGKDILRRPEDVDHVDRFRDIGKPGVDGLAQDVVTGLAGIARDYPVASFKEILEGEITRAVVFWRNANHSNRLHRTEDAADIVVRV